MASAAVLELSLILRDRPALKHLTKPPHPQLCGGGTTLHNQTRCPTWGCPARPGPRPPRRGCGRTCRPRPHCPAPRRPGCPTARRPGPPAPAGCLQYTYVVRYSVERCSQGSAVESSTVRCAGAQHARQCAGKPSRPLVCAHAPWLPWLPGALCVQHICCLPPPHACGPGPSPSQASCKHVSMCKRWCYPTWQHGAPFPSNAIPEHARAPSLRLPSLPFSPAAAPTHLAAWRAGDPGKSRAMRQGTRAAHGMMRCCIVILQRFKGSAQER